MLSSTARRPPPTPLFCNPPPPSNCGAPLQIKPTASQQSWSSERRRKLQRRVSLWNASSSFACRAFRLSRPLLGRIDCCPGVAPSGTTANLTYRPVNAILLYRPLLYRTPAPPDGALVACCRPQKAMPASNLPEYRHMRSGSLNIPPQATTTHKGTMNPAPASQRFEGPRSPPSEFLQSPALPGLIWPSDLMLLTPSTHSVPPVRRELPIGSRNRGRAHTRHHVAWEKQPPFD